MQNEFYDAWTAMTQQTWDNWKKLSETNLKLGEKLMREQVELGNAIIASATQNAQECASSKDMGQLAAKQAEWAQECGKKWLATSRTCADIVAEAGKTYNQILEAGVKSASDNMAGATKAATQAAKGQKAA